MAFLKSRIDGAYGVVDKHLAEREFLVGSDPTIADFSLSGYVFYPENESGLDLKSRFRGVAAWIERLERVPGWGDPYDVLPGTKIRPKW
jgi:glutathione S-transferase